MPPASSAGQQPALSTTARPAEKGTREAGLDPVAVRMAVNGITAMTGLRRKDAREVAVAYASTGRAPIPLDGWAHWLRSPETGRLDPTGETVVRRDRERGGANEPGTQRRAPPGRNALTPSTPV